jgi:hypothetical protein
MPGSPHYLRYKVCPPCTVESDIRPIAITSTNAKKSESIIDSNFNKHFSNCQDKAQFGCTANRSTTHALLKLMYAWFKASENFRNTTWILFVDFTKILLTTTYYFKHLSPIIFQTISLCGVLTSWKTGSSMS